MRTFSDQHSNYYERVQGGDRKLKRAEADLQDMARRMRDLEGDLAAGHILTDGLRADKELVSIFLENYITKRGGMKFGVFWIKSDIENSIKWTKIEIL